MTNIKLIKIRELIEQNGDDDVKMEYMMLKIALVRSGFEIEEI